MLNLLHIILNLSILNILSLVYLKSLWIQVLWCDCRFWYKKALFCWFSSWNTTKI